MFGSFFTDIWGYFFPKKVSFDQMNQISIIDPESTKTILAEQEALKEKGRDKKVSFDQMNQISIIDPESTKTILAEQEALKEKEPDKSLKARNKELEKAILERKELEEKEEIEKEKSSGKLNLSPTKKSFADLSSFVQEEELDVGNTGQEDAVSNHDEDYFINIEEIEEIEITPPSPPEKEEQYRPSAEVIRNTKANSLLGKTSTQLARK